MRGNNGSGDIRNDEGNDGDVMRWNGVLPMSEVEHAYRGSDADKTRAVFLRLIEHGAIGDVAINLLRTAKASERAKQYKGRYIRDAYAKKDWSIDQLCLALGIHHHLKITWGWSRDTKAINFEHVLYIDLPCGQVSFHTSYRRDGPDYPGQWDETRGETANRVIKFANAVLTGEPLNQESENVETARTEGAGPTRDEGEQLQQPEQQAAFRF